MITWPSPPNEVSRASSVPRSLNLYRHACSALPRVSRQRAAAQSGIPGVASTVVRGNPPTGGRGGGNGGGFSQVYVGSGVRSLKVLVWHCENAVTSPRAIHWKLFATEKSTLSIPGR